MGFTASRTPCGFYRTGKINRSISASLTRRPFILRLTFAAQEIDFDFVAVDLCELTSTIGQAGRGKQKKELIQGQPLDRLLNLKDCSAFRNFQAPCKSVAMYRRFPSCSPLTASRK